MQQTKTKTSAAKASQTSAKASAVSAKASAKGKAESAAKVKKTPFYAALYVAVLAGEFGDRAKAYYARADKYHKGEKTIFPRPRTEADRKSMTKEKAQEVIKRASLGTLASGNAEGQAVYDLMRIGADLSK